MYYPEELSLYSSNESLNLSSESELGEVDDISVRNWTLAALDENELIYSCVRCFHPIFYERDIIEDIRSVINAPIGFAVSAIHLLFGVDYYNEEPIEHWRAKVYCPDCGLVLTFIRDLIDPRIPIDFMANVFNYRNMDEQHVILIPPLLRRGTVNELRALFLQIYDGIVFIR